MMSRVNGFMTYSFAPASSAVATCSGSVFVVTMTRGRPSRVRSARTAVAAALAELVAENAFTEEKAFELARLYLHDNAAKLYGEKK